MITVDPKILLALVTLTVAVVTSLWHAAMHIGRLTVRMERCETKITDIEGFIADRRYHERRQSEARPS